MCVLSIFRSKKYFSAFVKTIFIFEAIFLFNSCTMSLDPVVSTISSKPYFEIGTGNMGVGAYLIRTPENLHWLAAYSRTNILPGGSTGIDKNVKLVADIDFGTKITVSDQRDGSLITIIRNGSFEGIQQFGSSAVNGISFDGNGYVIKNFTINKPETDNVGFIGINWAIISNLALENIQIAGRDNVGGIVGMNLGPISCSYSAEPHEQGIYESEPFITGRQRVGGLVGYNSTPPQPSIGDISNRYNTISNCYNTIDVRGRYYVGGISGSHVAVPYYTNYSVNDCYNIGNIEDFSLGGGISGSFFEGLANGCYFLIGVAEEINNGGPFGIRSIDAAQFGNENSFNGWSFGSIWEIKEGFPGTVSKRPVLKGVGEGR